MRLFPRVFAVLALSMCSLGLGAQVPFWDAPETVGFKGASFPQTVSNESQAAVLWQVKTSVEGGWPQFHLAISTRTAGAASWSEARQVLGPFTLTGGDSQFFAAVMTKSGDLWVAVLDQDGKIALYRSSDLGASFSRPTAVTSPRTTTLLVPRLFLNADDQPLLFVSEADETSIRLAAAHYDGQAWTPLTPLTTTDTTNTYQPSVTTRGKTVTVLYQSPNGRNNYQIFRRDSVDGGQTWGAASLLSDFDPTVNPEVYDNQRPNGLWWKDRLYVTWERRTAGTQTQIQWLVLDSDGKLVPGSPRELTTSDYSSRNPQLFTFQGALNVGWFDNQNRSYNQNLATYNAAANTFVVKQISDAVGNSYLGQPAVVGGELYYFWQYVFGTGSAATSQVILLKPDKFVLPPTIRPLNYVEGRRSKNPDFSLQLVFPKDISGVNGVNWIVTQNPSPTLEHVSTVEGKDPILVARAASEGDWYVAAIVRDQAGNWSAPAIQKLTLDLSPPGPVLVDLPAVDTEGFLTSNTFQLTWKTSSGDGAGYSARLDRVGDLQIPATLQTLRFDPVSAYPTLTEAKVSRENLENGVWALSISAFDEAGNQGPTTHYFFRLNKFKPFTIIQSVTITEDEFQRYMLELRGIGFLQDGRVTGVVLDRDGRSPWDYEIPPESLTDRLITVRAADLKEGTYRIGVLHTVRGTVLATKTLSVGPGGTVKIGDFRNLEQTAWEFFQGISVYFSVNTAFFWSVFLLLTAAIVLSALQLRRVVAQMRRVDTQAADLFTDSYTKRAEAARRVSMKRKGLGLAFKFAASILSLTVLVILMLALVLGFLITENSRTSLGEGLRQRAEVLLDGLVSRARANLPNAESNETELLLIPSQIVSMQKDKDHNDAIYATVEGRYKQKAKAGYSFVWSSNDPNLLKKIDTKTVQAGQSTWKENDTIEKAYLALQTKFNTSARARVGELASQVDELQKQVPNLKADDPKFTLIKNQTSELKGQIAVILAEIGQDTYTEPRYDTATLLTSGLTRYVFYKPVLYYEEGDNETFVKGLVRLEVSTDSIIRDITSAQQSLQVTTLGIGLVALLLGLVGSFILSRITVNPIRRLVKGVEIIRDTDDKTHLEGHVIQLNTGDELSDLAQSINQMTRGLVDGANKTQDLTKGKIEQKTLFIPLDTDTDNQKLTTFHRDLKDIEVFAYYEGAKLVSGDLYEFRQLDTREGANKDSPWYGIMKGDVSGKGVEAGMIMAIAAMFITTFFRKWTEAKDARDTKVDSLLYQVNDTLEPILAEAGRGLFVALNVGVLNAKTGHLRYGQAGDNVLHVWRGAKQEYETVPLPNTISVGAMPSFLHNVRYANRDLVIHSGDTLLYFTDGIEESQSAFRNAQWEPVAYFDPEDPTTIAEPGARKEVHPEGAPENVRRTVQAQGTEDFGPERIKDVITAFYKREVYTLVKKNCPVPGLEFHFDFSTCDGSAQQLVTAMISIDRIFRLVPDPKATNEDQIQLDLVQDEFLRAHFTEFHQYFKNGKQLYQKADVLKGDIADADGYKLVGGKKVLQDAAYIWYENLKEDHQFDDLTLLAIRKK